MRGNALCDNEEGLIKMKILQKTLLVVTIGLAPLMIANQAKSEPQLKGGFYTGKGNGKPAPAPTPRPKPIGPIKSGDE